MAVSTITTLIGAFKDVIIKACDDIKTEVEFFIDNGLSDYIESIHGKFANTKTFLYRNENVPFKDVFFPVSLEIGNVVKKVTSYDDLFSNSKYVSIIGIAGSGKTMLMKHFFLTSIDTLYRIPIYIELRNLNDYEKTFTDFIYEVIFNNKLSPNQKILERLLITGQFLLLLDGYDEIYSNKKDKITNDLDKFIDRYSKNEFIISSRPGSGIESLPRFDNYFVQQLSDKEVFDFIDLVLKGADDKELAGKIKSVIGKAFHNDYSNFLRSPLLLSMFILTFNTYPELPHKKSKFYWNVFDTLATKHDSFTKKGGYQHERKTGLQNEDFEKILQWFSYKALFDGKLNFDSEYLTKTLSDIKEGLKFNFSVESLIQDLTLAISIIIIDGVEYKFPHKSLQEYFSAVLIKNQSEEAKEKIYKEKFQNQVSRSTGGYDNLWSLCNELDRISFTKNFLLVNLKIFRDHIKSNDVIEQLKNFYQFTRFGDLILLKEDCFEFTGTYSYGTNLSIHMALCEFLEIGNLFNYTLYGLSIGRADEDLFKIINERKDSLELDENEERAEGENFYYFNMKDHLDAEVLEHLRSLNADGIISELIIKVEKKIDVLQNEISDEVHIADSLLGI